MLQEEQTVPFQPIGYDGHVPWFVNLFVIYLLVPRQNKRSEKKC
jgi:hypothetical protein